jgi:hypothetical protein
MALAIVGAVAGVFLGSSGLLALLLFLRRRRVRLGAKRSVRGLEEDVNVLGGLVLPLPDDVRWRGCRELMRFGGGRLLRVEDGNRLYIDGRQVPHSPQADRYCGEVVAAVRQRRLEELTRKIDEAVEKT